METSEYCASQLASNKLSASIGARSPEKSSPLLLTTNALTYRTNCGLCFAGLWAVVHTGGLALSGVIERQASSAWDSMLRHNLVAPLRAARVFIPLLRAKRGKSPIPICPLACPACGRAIKFALGMLDYVITFKFANYVFAQLKCTLKNMKIICL